MNQCSRVPSSIKSHTQSAWLWFQKHSYKRSNDPGFLRESCQEPDRIAYRVVMSFSTKMVRNPSIFCQSVCNHSLLSYDSRLSFPICVLESSGLYTILLHTKTHWVHWTFLWSVCNHSLRSYFWDLDSKVTRTIFFSTRRFTVWSIHQCTEAAVRITHTYNCQGTSSFSIVGNQRRNAMFPVGNLINVLQHVIGGWTTYTLNQ